MVWCVNGLMGRGVDHFQKSVRDLGFLGFFGILGDFWDFWDFLGFLGFFEIL